MNANRSLSIAIRTASQGDSALLAEIIRRSFRGVAERFDLTPENCPKHPSNCTAEWIASDLSRGVQYFILEAEGEPCGCVGLERPGPDVSFLERLAVLPSSRRKGYGEAMVLHVLEQARASGAGRVQIGIIAGHLELKRWYENLGFVETETKAFEHLPFQVLFMVHDAGEATEFRQLLPEESEEAYSVVCEASEWLLGKGITMWRRPLPKRIYADRQERGFNFGLWQNGTLAVVVSLTDDRPDYWADDLPEGRLVWLATLASRVSMKGRGLGERTMSLAEQHVRDSGLRRICLDCSCVNGFLPSFYSRLGYKTLRRKHLFADPEFDSALMTKEL